MPHGLVHESEEKLRAHFFAHGDPLSDWTIRNLLTGYMGVSIIATATTRSGFLLILQKKSSAPGSAGGAYNAVQTCDI